MYAAPHASRSAPPETQSRARAVAVARTALTGRPISTTRGAPNRLTIFGIPTDAASAPTPHRANSTPSRKFPARTFSERSAHTTSWPTNAPPATDCVAPTSVIVRTFACPIRNRRPSRTSATRTDAVSGRRPGSGSDSARAIPRIRSAEATNDSASNAISVGGATTASSAPAAAGRAISTTVPAPQIAAFASAIRSRPTSVGTAPKFAASKHTKIVGDSSAAISTCGTVSTPKAAATGSEPSAAALARSAVTMTRRRSHRSASAPATSPSSRYGTASNPATTPVRSGERVIAYTRTGRATYVIEDPARDTIRADQNRRKSGSSRSRSAAGAIVMASQGATESRVRPLGPSVSPGCDSLLVTVPDENYQSLYRKYRPQGPDEVLGQEHVVRSLVGALKEGRLSHAFLFCGPRGTGKTSTARILAKMVNCENGPTPTPCGTCDQCVRIRDGSHLDVVEIDAASHGGVEDARELRERAPTAPVQGREKVYILDEAQRLSREAFDALLKLFEEPPRGVRFVLCTTEPHKMPATIVGRCQRFDFRRGTSDVLSEHLVRIAKSEGVTLSPEAAVA